MVLVYLACSRCTQIPYHGKLSPLVGFRQTFTPTAIKATRSSWTSMLWDQCSTFWINMSVFQFLCNNYDLLQPWWIPKLIQVGQSSWDFNLHQGFQESIFGQAMSSTESSPRSSTKGERTNCSRRNKATNGAEFRFPHLGRCKLKTCEDLGSEKTDPKQPGAKRIQIGEPQKAQLFLLVRVWVAWNLRTKDEHGRMKIFLKERIDAADIQWIWRHITITCAIEAQWLASADPAPNPHQACCLSDYLTLSD